MSIVLSLTGLSPSLAGFPKTILLRLLNQLCGPNPGMHASRFGLFRFRSPLLPESHVVFSSSGYLDVSVHRVPFLTLWIGVRILEVCSSGFPHSEISGSMDICSSPKLFAAYHVFHRLLVRRPRNFQHIIHRRVNRTAVDFGCTFAQCLHHILLDFRRLDHHRLKFCIRHREMKLVAGLDICCFFEHRHQFRQVEELCKTSARTVSGAFWAQVRWQ